MTNPAEPSQANKPIKPRALTYTEMMNDGRQQMDEAEHAREQSCSRESMPCRRTLISWSNASLSRCLNNKSHYKDCNRDSATEVSNVRVESFHSASAGRMSLLFFLWPMAKA